MMRDTTFLVGGALVVGLGAALAVGLAWAGAGWYYAGTWFASALAIGFGAFFVYVGTEERRSRRRWLAGYDPNRPGAGDPPP